jgi:pyruvate dehydrogenase E2 component (dihydrolipoamide acetyltransferase)
MAHITPVARWGGAEMLAFKLPSLGSDMDSGTLLEWRVAPGQAVKKGDVLAVVDTSKAAVDVETWDDGRVHRLVTTVGETVPVGSVMAWLLAPGEAAPADDAPPQTLAPSLQPLQARPAVAPAGATKKAAPGQPVPAAILPGMTAPPGSPVGPRSGLPPPARRADLARPRVTPVARRRAAVLGIALDLLQGSGADRTITLADVERAARQPGGEVVASPTPATTPATGAVPRLEAAAAPTAADRAAAMRQAIAAAMARSKREIPHYYLAQAIPMRAALDWLQAFNAGRSVTQRLLPAVLLLKAVALAVREVPEMNGRFIDGVFKPAPTSHVGVAISLRQGGLVAPALHDVADQPLDRLMTRLADLVRRARAGSLRSSEMSDPTLTVTNLGDTGADTVFGVIYPPQVALVGFGRIADRPAVDEAGQLVVMPTVIASLAADHRASDGHRGALFLARLQAFLQQPDRLAASPESSPESSAAAAAATRPDLEGSP